MSEAKAKMEVDKKAAIYEEELRVTQILDLIPAHIYWKHKNEYYLGCNKQQRLTLGKDLTGTSEYDGFPKDEADKIHENDQYVLDHGSFAGEELGTDANGVTKTYFSSKTRLLNSKGEVTGLVGITVDINDNKEKDRLEKEILKSERLVYETERIQQQKFKKVVDQAVHDLGSPLMVLNFLIPGCSGLPENQRDMLARAISRIYDISRNLLNYADKPFEELSGSQKTKPSPTLVGIAILEIFSEKRFEYSQLPIEFTAHIDQKDYFTTIHISETDLKRTLSNIINNSVDALKEDANGKINVDLYLLPDRQVQIIISDNGNGMPEEVRHKILSNTRVTAGKDDGHGIGFSQIWDTVKSGNGTLEIESEQGKGTKIILIFPQVSPEDWLCTRISLFSDDTVIILDDEQSIHGAWESKFAKEAPSINRRHFNHGAEVVKFIGALSSEEKDKLFLLTDYELLRQGINGLDVIRKTNIQRSILVTSHYNDQKVRKQAEQANTKILPKVIAVGINIDIC